MSDGPYSRWLKTYQPKRVSTTDADRVCAVEDFTTGRTYCGRRKSPRTMKPEEVTCFDCIAAAEADLAAATSVRLGTDQGADAAMYEVDQDPDQADRCDG